MICVVFLIIPYKIELFLRNSAVSALLFLYNGWRGKVGWAGECLNKMFHGWFYRLSGLHSPELKPLELLPSLPLRSVWNDLELVQVRSELRQEPSCVTPRETQPCCTCLWQTDLHWWRSTKNNKGEGSARKLSLNTGSACAITHNLQPSCAAVAEPLGLQYVKDERPYDLMGSPVTMPRVRCSVPLGTLAFTTTPPPVPMVLLLQGTGRVPVLAVPWCPHLTHEWPAVTFFHCLTLF